MRAAAVAVATIAALAASSPAVAAGGLAITVDRTAISTELGRKFELRSTISNRGAAPAAGLIVHLNVLSLRPGLYVDPEDWSSSRTRYLAPIPAGGSTTITWRLAAVNSGSIGVYVAVLPRSAGTRPVTGPTVRVAIARRQTLDAGGILPLALSVPALLGVLTLAFRFRRRESASG
jgi:hypothetical protein